MRSVQSDPGACVRERERGRACMREREGVRARERERACVRAREGGRACVREREGVRVREHALCTDSFEMMTSRLARTRLDGTARVRTQVL
eukprot:1673686-Pleurochrysis_carterae.AAC.1